MPNCQMWLFSWPDTKEKIKTAQEAAKVVPGREDHCLFCGICALYETSNHRYGHGGRRRVARVAAALWQGNVQNLFQLQREGLSNHWWLHTKPNKESIPSNRYGTQQAGTLSLDTSTTMAGGVADDGTGHQNQRTEQDIQE